MKKYWPIFFLFSIILFQGYVYNWNKNQTVTLANNQRKITPTPSLSSVPKTANNCTSIQSFYYPQATVKENHERSIFMETSDDPSHILQWYEDKLHAENVSIMSRVVNTTNGTSTYMLVGEKDSLQITVIIGRDTQESSTTIFIHHNLCN